MAPVADAEVDIPPDRCVTLDVDPPHLKNLTVRGTLVFADTGDRQLRTGWLLIDGGELRIGTVDQPFVHRATITLTDADLAGDATHGMGTRGLLVMDGRLTLVGRTLARTWTKIDAHAAAGATDLVLAEPVDWSPGDEVVIAPTDFYGVAQTDRRTIAAVAADGLSLELTTGLSASRWGRLQYPAPGLPGGLSLDPQPFVPPSTDGVPEALDERAEIGLLSRNIVVEAPDDAAWQNHGFGAQVMVMGLGSRVMVDGVQFRRAGQAGRLGRYPFHWHLLSQSGATVLGDAIDNVLRNSAVSESRNRCVVVHGTNGVIVQGNVCHDVRGHALFVEDGVERRNVFDGNLVLRVRNPAPGAALQQHEVTSQAMNGSSGLWLTNPDNVVTNNAVADVQGTGFWLAFPAQPLGLSSMAPLAPRHMALGVFEDNVAHSSNEFGFNIDNVPVDAAGNTVEMQYQPTANGAPPGAGNPGIGFTLSRLTSYKNRAAFWNRVYRPVFEGFVTADSPGKQFAGSTSGGVVRRSLVIGTSLNSANDWQDMAADPAFAGHKQVFPPAGFASYHGGVAMEQNVVINFPFIDSAANTSFGDAPSGAFATDDYYIRPVDRSLAQNFDNLLIESAPGRRSWPSFDNFVFSGAIQDAEGLVGVAGHNWVYDVPFLTHGGNCAQVAPAGSNGASCDGEYFGAEAFVLDHANQHFEPYMRLEVSRRDPSAPASEVGAWVVAGVPPALASQFMLPNMRHFAMRAGGAYVLRFPEHGGPLTDVNMVISNMHDATDAVVLAVHFRGATARVFATTAEAFARDPAVAGELGPSTASFRRYEPAASVAAVIAGPGETFHHDAAAELVWIKLRGGIADIAVGDPSPFSDETLYQPFVLRVHDDQAD